jgi:tetratricopeptide (TPR) repeat protein
LEEKIVAKTGGNPFFVEEMVRDLLARGDVVQKGDRYVSRQPIDQLDIPSSVQGVLAARMDRLSEDLKRTMQVASVIGRDFAYKILGSIMELGGELRTHLTNLVGIEILYEKALYPELEYIFKHALTQEVAYESLLKQRRRELHGRIARTIEEMFAERLEQHYEVLAHHYELSDSPDRAIDYLVLAGEKSNRSAAANAAVDFFTRALNQIKRSDRASDPNLMKRIRAGRAAPLHAMGNTEECMEDYQEAIRLARATGDQQMELGCLTEIPPLIIDTTLNDKIPHFCEQGLELARALGDKGAEARIMTSDAVWRHFWHKSDGYETVKNALGIAEESGQPAALGHVRLYLSVLERWRGNPQRSLELVEGMVEKLQSVFNIFVASGVAVIHGWALTDAGKYSEAIRFQSQRIDILEHSVNYPWLIRCCNGQGWTYSEVYDLEKAFHFSNRGLENAVAMRKIPGNLQALHMQAHAEVNLMENEFEMGKVDEAWDHITRFEEASAHPNYDFERTHWTNRMKDLKGTILLSRGDLDGAEELAGQCLEENTKFGYKKNVGKAERLFGQILIKRGGVDLAETKLTQALAKLEEVENPKQLWITHSALARLYKKMNRPDLERAQWQAAKAIVQATADGLEDQGLRQTFINAAPVQEIMEKANC